MALACSSAPTDEMATHVFSPRALFPEYVNDSREKDLFKIRPEELGVLDRLLDDVRNLKSRAMLRVSSSNAANSTLP